MDRSGHEFLSHAAFAHDENGSRRVGRVGDLLVDIQHGRRAPDETSWRADGDLGGRFSPVRALLEGVIDDTLDFLDIERLADVIERPGTDGFNGRFQRAKPADEHHGHTLLVPEPPQQIEP